MALQRGRGGGTVHSKAWPHSSLSGSDSNSLLFFALPSHSLDPGAAFSLPDPNFSHQGTTWFKKKTKEEKSIKHVSFSLNPSPVKNSHKRVEEIWNNTQTFVICLKAPTLDGVHIHSLWKPLGGNSTYFCPTGNVERLETFLAGQQAIKDPTDHTLQFTDMNQAATGYTSAAAEVTELSRELCLRFHNQTEVQLCPVST